MRNFVVRGIELNLNWEFVAAVTELVGAITIVSTLVYLALQVRQSNIAAGVSAQQEMTRQYADFTDTLLSDSNLYRIYSHGQRGDRFEDDLEAQQFRTLLGKMTWFFSSMHYHYLNTELDEDEWHQSKSLIMGACHWKGFRQWWVSSRNSFPERFIKFIDTEILDATPHKDS
ncbi:MAG: hypothetical protein ACJAYE_001169 [Candidatus Azotimanducaceae bacterium]|jgi:hypothetical protein